MILHSLQSLRVTYIYPLCYISMCADDENPSTTNTAIFILLPVAIILLILVIAIALVIITLLVRWKKREKHCPAQLDHEERIYDKAHFPLDSSNSATKSDDVMPNVAYGKAGISGTGCDDVKYVMPNVAYGKVNTLGT